ncbi:MAG TPA: glycosyltransferase family 39 protein [Steroidobacteraceae bacterium]|nr:glycosyltransferase family 39 protein [Steroidobacteraceae bacterium]
MSDGATPVVVMRVRTVQRALIALALALCVGSWIVLGAFRGLYNPDEARYAEIPREMLAAGDWVVPHLDGLVYIEKPPLQYWCTAIAYRLFGASAWSARLLACLAGLGTVLVTAWLGGRLWNRRAAGLSGLIAASSVLVMLMSHQLTLDMLLTFFMTVTLAGFCIAQDARTATADRDRWMLIAWAAAAAAFLTKGLEAGALPILALAGYSVLQRDFAPWRRLALPVGLPLFLLITLPWLGMIEHRLPAFFEFFFVREHFERFLTRIEARYQPWWFFGEVLAVGALPWIVPMARALAGGWRASQPRGTFDARRLLWVWSLIVLVFFSASHSKLIPYILPMFPALALLAASLPEARLRRDLRLTGGVLTALGVALALAALILPRLLHQSARAPYFASLRAPLAVIGAVAIVGGGSALASRGASLALTARLAGTSYLCFLGILWAAALLAPIYSSGPLVAQLSPALRAVPAVYSVGMYDQGLPFYLRRTVTLVDYRGELDFGLTLAPQKGIATLAEFARRWRATPQALAAMAPMTYGKLARQSLPMVVRARAPNELIVSRR